MKWYSSVFRRCHDDIVGGLGLFFLFILILVVGIIVGAESLLFASSFPLNIHFELANFVGHRRMCSIRLRLSVAVAHI